MSDKPLPTHRFLMETCSQHLYREETMRRRRELLERESTRPPVMRFGGGGSRSVSPAPRAAKSSSPLPANSTSRPRPHSRERSRRLPPVPSPRGTKRPGAKSCNSGSAVSSRVTSPVPAVHAREGRSLPPAQKRSRSASQTELRTKCTRRSPRCATSVSRKEPKVPFMCSGSPKKKSASPRKRSTSRTPPPLPFPGRSEAIDQTVVDVPVPTLRAEEKEEAVFFISPFALPNTTNHHHHYHQEALSGVVSLRPEEDEEPMSLRVGEFQLPRTPRRRSSGVLARISQTPSSAIHPYHDVEKKEEGGEEEKKEEKEEEKTEKETVDQHGHFSAEVGEVCDTSPKVETSLPRCFLRTEISPIKLTDNDDGGADTSGKTQEPIESAVAITHSGNERISLSLLSAADTMDVSLAVEHEATAQSMLSFHACECSPTTTEASETIKKEDEGRQLLFDSDDTLEEVEGEEEEEKVEKEEKANHSDTLPMGESVPPVPESHNESDAPSRRFYDCTSAPLTPDLQLPETYRLLEATRLEMATSSNYPRVPRRLGERRNEEGRSSLVLVKGELPITHTPFIQEPRTPPPSDMPKRHSPLTMLQPNTLSPYGLATPPPQSATAATSFNESPIPRPVTLRSQLCSPSLSSRRRVAASFSESPRADVRGMLHSARTSMTGVSTYKEELPKSCEAGQPQGQREETGGVGETLPTPEKCCRLTGKTKSAVEQLTQSSLPDARENVEHPIAVDTLAQTPSCRRDSGQLSDVVTDASSTSQRVAAHPRKHHYDYTYWEGYLREVTRQSAQKERRKAAKRSKKASTGAAVVKSEAEDEKKSANVQDMLVYDEEPKTSKKTTATRGMTDTSQKSLSNASVNSSQSQSKNSQRKGANSVCASLKKAMSRKNRDRILRQRRFKARRQNKKRQ